MRIFPAEFPPMAKWTGRMRLRHIQERMGIGRRLCKPDLATQTGQVQDKFHTQNPNITELVRTIQDKELSVKEIMEGMDLKGRDNFLKLYLSPAISEGFIIIRTLPDIRIGNTC
jgi:hypothetical protein